MRGSGVGGWRNVASPTRGWTAGLRAIPRGLLLDEYLPSEQADNVAAIAWLAAQSWCNGAVGMRGVSWGGFATLQAAALAAAGVEGDHVVLRVRPALHRRCSLCRRDLRADGAEVGDQLQAGDGRAARSRRLRTRTGSRRGWRGWTPRRRSPPSGSPTSARTPTGGKARWASRPNASPARPTSSAAGPTRTTRPFRACLRR